MAGSRDNSSGGVADIDAGAYDSIGSSALSDEYIGLLSNDAFLTWRAQHPELERAFDSGQSSPLERRMGWVAAQQSAVGNNPAVLGELRREAGGNSGLALVPSANGYYTGRDMDTRHEMVARAREAAAKGTMSENVGGLTLRYTPSGEVGFFQGGQQVNVEANPAALNGTGYYLYRYGKDYNPGAWEDRLIDYQFGRDSIDLAHYNDLVRKAVGLVGTCERNGAVTSRRLGEEEKEDPVYQFACTVIRYHYEDDKGNGTTYTSYDQALFNRLDQRVAEGNFGTRFTGSRWNDYNGDYSGVSMKDIGTNPGELGRAANIYNRILVESYGKIQRILWNGGVNLDNYGGEQGRYGKAWPIGEMQRVVNFSLRRSAQSGASRGRASGYLASKQEDLQEALARWTEAKTIIDRIAQMSMKLYGMDYADYIAAYVGDSEETYPWWEDHEELAAASNAANKKIREYNTKLQSDSETQGYYEFIGMPSHVPSETPYTAENGSDGSIAGSTENPAGRSQSIGVSGERNRRL